MSLASETRCIIDGSSGPLVRRKILVFRRLEPGDVRTPGTHLLPHSPYLEALPVEVAMGKSFHDDMVRVQQKRAETLTAGKSLMQSFDIPGMLIAGAGGGVVGSYLGYMPEHFRPALLGIFGVGVAFGVVTFVLRKRAEEAALQRWKSLPEYKEHERIGRELAEAWVRFTAQVKRESGFHTELRVGEGGSDPQRLCSIDPRGFLAIPPTFDPEDWLPTEGGGIRYEEVDVMGELVTRGLEGVDDVSESKPEKPEKADKAAEKPEKPEDAKADAKAADPTEDGEEEPEEAAGEGEAPKATA